MHFQAHTPNTLELGPMRKRELRGGIGNKWGRKIINTTKQEQGLAGNMRRMLCHVEKGHQLNLLHLPEI